MTERVNIAVDKERHETTAQIAKLLGLTLKEAVDQALSEWTKSRAPEAKKRARQVLQAA